MDGTFYDGRRSRTATCWPSATPPSADSLPRLAGGRGQVYFTHMNHTNPLLDPKSPERASLPAGFHVLEEGSVFDL